ncbi:MAG: hypothetical protein IJ719_08010 [Clostridia bacterium]|nr:hypothetical protein [Clostridia bacterium]
MPRRASRPEWVAKYVQSGQYVNKVNSNYYLYSAHSERKEGIPYPVRVCDGYIGRITQEEGLIPSKGRNRSASQTPAVSPPNVWAFGVHAAILKCTDKIQSGLQRSSPDHASLIYVMSILDTVYGHSNQVLYEMSVLSFAFPGLTIPVSGASSEVQSGIERGKKMIRDAIQKTYGDDWALLQAYLSLSVIVKNTRGYKVTDIQSYASDLVTKYGLKLDTAAFEELNRKGR